jgi:hypothetical protein
MDTLLLLKRTCAPVIHERQINTLERENHMCVPDLIFIQYCTTSSPTKQCDGLNVNLRNTRLKCLFSQKINTTLGLSLTQYITRACGKPRTREVGWWNGATLGGTGQAIRFV